MLLAKSGQEQESKGLTGSATMLQGKLTVSPSYLLTYDAGFSIPLLSLGVKASDQEFPCDLMTEDSPEFQPIRDL
jgi:hypothetical protein